MRDPVECFASAGGANHIASGPAEMETDQGNHIRFVIHGKDQGSHIS